MSEEAGSNLFALTADIFSAYPEERGSGLWIARFDR